MADADRGSSLSPPSQLVAILIEEDETAAEGANMAEAAEVARLADIPGELGQKCKDGAAAWRAGDYDLARTLLTDAIGLATQQSHTGALLHARHLLAFPRLRRRSPRRIPPSPRGGPRRLSETGLPRRNGLVSL